ncbi:MAG: hypothetical protein M1820_004779 [Bogoriella megaspora]|nr:MAG: hypothetical protein M1820_004779 [Bogoriella megaspora]
MPFLATEKCQLSNKDILSWIFDNPTYDLDKPIYVNSDSPSEYISARQAKLLIRQLCAGFRKLGLKPGDCVTVHAFNSIYYPIVVLGIIAFGGIFAGTNPAYTPLELAHHFKTSRTKFLLSESEILEPLLAAAKENNISRSSILSFDTAKPLTNTAKIAEGLESWQMLLKYGEEEWARFDDEYVQSTTEAARFFSSGTTGLPKAAMDTHRNFVNQHTIMWEYEPRPWKIRRLIALPMFHAAVGPHIHFSPLRDGVQCFIQRRFALEPYIAAIEKFQITDLIIVPPQVILILNAPHLTAKYSFKSLKHAICGAAPLDKDPQAQFEALLAPEARFTQVWGMTEATCMVAGFHWYESDDTGSIGRLKPNMDVKIVDDDGKDISDFDIRGELCIRGPGVVKGYLGAKEGEVNRKDWDGDGYYHSGDIGYRSSKNGLWYLVDRKKELIKVRAFQVAPAELEGVLLMHTGIADAGVIGVRLEDQGSEFPRAYVVRKPNDAGKVLSEAEVQHYIASQLSSYKRLDGGVVFVDAIPKNASGKILKRLLRERAAKELGPKL